VRPFSLWYASLFLIRNSKSDISLSAASLAFFPPPVLPPNRQASVEYNRDTLFPLVIHPSQVIETSVCEVPRRYRCAEGRFYIFSFSFPSPFPHVGPPPFSSRSRCSWKGGQKNSAPNGWWRSFSEFCSRPHFQLLRVLREIGRFFVPFSSALGGFMAYGAEEVDQEVFL